MTDRGDRRDSPAAVAAAHPRLTRGGRRAAYDKPRRMLAGNLAPEPAGDQRRFRDCFFDSTAGSASAVS
ncbi:MAG TPA: hypothetical protein DCE44_11770 [Verrucomicrobiales bacterium]|nr:hypothetical protein [Verrucomicrobiales bacterium]